jgi:hypothetical protein
MIPGVLAYFQLRKTVQRWRYTIQTEVSRRELAPGTGGT